MVNEGELIPGPGFEHRPVIMLVEDEVLVRLACSELLRDENYTVLEAADAAEALQLFESGHPVDLVITDVRMPGEMDGLALTAELKGKRPYLPVLIVSAYPGENPAHVANAFLSKPYMPSELLETVSDLMGVEWQNRQTPRSY
jgi:CheY-like chemotaxis protein